MLRESFLKVGNGESVFRIPMDSFGELETAMVIIEYLRKIFRVENSAGDSWVSSENFAKLETT